jgi:two-component system response regulator (stage 0 sporulation protein F)
MANILIVDDQSYVRELLSEELAHEGYRVACVGDSTSIWGHLRDQWPHLVLFDLYLDGFKGWEILRDIKREDPNLPVLILTAYDTYVEDSRLSLADGYVVKSFVDLDGLKKKIVAILRRKTALQPRNNRYPIRPCVATDEMTID